MLQGLAILFVVYAHAVIPGQHFTGPLEIFDRFVRACCVPLFIFISGYLYCYTNGGSKPAGHFLKERASRLLLPYFCLSSIAFVIKANLGSLAARSLPFTWASYAHQLFYPWDNAVIFFWFIPTLMLVCIASVFIDKWVIQKRPSALLPLLAALAVLSTTVGINQIAYPVRFLNFCGALNYLFYFWAGFAAIRYEKAIMSILGSVWRGALFVCAAVALTILLPNADHFFALLEATLACFSLLVFTNSLAMRHESSTLMTVGDLSFQIYLLSWFFQTMPIVALTHFVRTNQYACAAISIVLGAGGPLLVSYVVRARLKFARPLIGLR